MITSFAIDLYLIKDLIKNSTHMKWGKFSSTNFNNVYRCIELFVNIISVIFLFIVSIVIVIAVIAIVVVNIVIIGSVIIIIHNNNYLLIEEEQQEKKAKKGHTEKDLQANKRTF